MKICQKSPQIWPCIFLLSYMCFAARAALARIDDDPNSSDDSRPNEEAAKASLTKKLASSGKWENINPLPATTTPQQGQQANHHKGQQRKPEENPPPTATSSKAPNPLQQPQQPKKNPNELITHLHTTSIPKVQPKHPNNGTHTHSTSPVSTTPAHKNHQQRHAEAHVTTNPAGVKAHQQRHAHHTHHTHLHSTVPGLNATTKPGPQQKGGNNPPGTAVTLPRHQHPPRLHSHQPLPAGIPAASLIASDDVAQVIKGSGITGLMEPDELRSREKFQFLHLYTDRRLEGKSASLYANYCRDLRFCFDTSFDKAVSSVRLWGVWVFYQDYNFGLDGGKGSVLWVWNQNYTFNLREEMDNAVSSMRFVGPSNDYFADSLTFYSGELLKGYEYFVYADFPTFPGFDYTVKSAVVTGGAGWTIYEKEFYKGKKVCLTPGQKELWRQVPGGESIRNPPPNPGFYTKQMSLRLDSIRSVKKGCGGDVERVSPDTTVPQPNSFFFFVSPQLNYNVSAGRFN